MTNNIMFDNILSSILLDMGITTPVGKFEIDGLLDTPGHHWSNPGVKQISAYSGGNEYHFVLKTLAEHSKREIEVYKFLNTLEDFPVPRLYYSAYNEENDEYWMIIERCLERDFREPKAFWNECGILLARIHSVFWNNTEHLPIFFHPEQKTDRLAAAVGRLHEFLDSLSVSDVDILESEIDVSLNDLNSCLEDTDIERLTDLQTPDLCLIHGSFHSPEIMWRETHDGFTPLGVDWESSRIGSPAEDLCFAAQNLLPKEEGVLFELFMDSYFKELAENEIHTDRKSLLTLIQQEALIKITDGVIPFLLQTYLKVRKDKSFEKWCEWLRGSLPNTTRYILDLISSGEIYTFSIPG